MFVKPAPGLKVRHPQTGQHIPAEGVEVPDGDSYWQRRLRSGDVVLMTRPVLTVTTRNASPTKGKE